MYVQNIYNLKLKIMKTKVNYNFNDLTELYQLNIWQLWYLQDTLIDRYGAEEILVEVLRNCSGEQFQDILAIFCKAMQVKFNEKDILFLEDYEKMG